MHTGSASRRKRRRPIRQAVPEDVRDRLDAALRAEAKLTRDVLARIHESFDLEDAHDVSLRQLTAYARALPREQAGATDSPAPDTAAFPDESSSKTASFRARMQDHGRLLSTMARALEDLDPVEWGRGAYFALLGNVFDILNGKYVGIELKDLTALSKIVAEQRRAETRAAASRSLRKGKDKANSTDETEAARPLPENFGEIVQRIYGTNLQRDVKS